MGDSTRSELLKETFNGAELTAGKINFENLSKLMEIAITRGKYKAVEFKNECEYTAFLELEKEKWEGSVRPLEAKVVDELKSLMISREGALKSMEILHKLGSSLSDEGQIENMKLEILSMQKVIDTHTTNSNLSNSTKKEVFKMKWNAASWGEQQNAMYEKLLNAVSDTARSKILKFSNYSAAWEVLQSRYGDDKKNSYEEDQIQQQLEDLKMDEKGPMSVFDQAEGFMEKFNSMKNVMDGVTEEKSDKDLIKCLLDSTKGDSKWKEFNAKYELDKSTKQGMFLLKSLELARFMQLYFQRNIMKDETETIAKAKEGGLEVECFACHKKGHRKRNCPTIVCNNCSKRGHMGYDCPKGDGKAGERKKFDKKRFDKSKERKKGEESPPPNSNRKFGEKKKGKLLGKEKEVVQRALKALLDESSEEEEEDGDILKSLIARFYTAKEVEAVNENEVEGEEGQIVQDLLSELFKVEDIKQLVPQKKNNDGFIVGLELEKGEVKLISQNQGKSEGRGKEQ